MAVLRPESQKVLHKNAKNNNFLKFRGILKPKYQQSGARLSHLASLGGYSHP